MSLSKEAKELLKNNAEVVKEIMTLYSTSDWFGFNYDYFIKLNTSPPVRFKTEDGVEISDGDKYWFVMEDYSKFLAVCSNVHSCGTDKLCKYFSTEQAAKEWIELNKPCELSVNDIVEWWFNKSEENNTMREAKNDLLELIKAKKQ